MSSRLVEGEVVDSISEYFILTFTLHSDETCIGAGFTAMRYVFYDNEIPPARLNKMTSCFPSFPCLAFCESLRKGLPDFAALRSRGWHGTFPFSCFWLSLSLILELNIPAYASTTHSAMLQHGLLASRCRYFSSTMALNSIHYSSPADDEGYACYAVY
jgi:hypothetical protein